MRMIRTMYERVGDQRFDVEAHLPVGRGFVILDHPAVHLLQAGQEVALGVEGDVPLGGLEVNVPALGKLAGTVRAMDGEATVTERQSALCEGEYAQYAWEEVWPPKTPDEPLGFCTECNYEGEAIGPHEPVPRAPKKKSSTESGRAFFAILVQVS